MRSSWQAKEVSRLLELALSPSGCLPLLRKLRYPSIGSIYVNMIVRRNCLCYSSFSFPQTTTRTRAKPTLATVRKKMRGPHIYTTSGENVRTYCSVKLCVKMSSTDLFILQVRTRIWVETTAWTQARMRIKSRCLPVTANCYSQYWTVGARPGWQGHCNRDIEIQVVHKML